MLSFAAVVVPDLRERPLPQPPVPESPILVPSTPSYPSSPAPASPRAAPRAPSPPASPSSPFPSVKRSRVIRSRVVPVSAATSPTAAGLIRNPRNFPRPRCACRCSSSSIAASSNSATARPRPRPRPRVTRRRPGHPRAPGPAPAGRPGSIGMPLLSATTRCPPWFPCRRSRATSMTPRGEIGRKVTCARSLRAALKTPPPPLFDARDPSCR